MVKDSLSDDDANSTQLTGKKLKESGVIFTDKDGQLVEIEVDSPSLELESEPEQEFFVQTEYGEEKETEQEREERKRREMLAHKNIDKQAQQKIEIKDKNQGNPNLKLDKIEQGIENSQHDGRPVHESAGVQAQELKEALKAIEAKNLPDSRGGDERGR
jgi:hypothetical protein